MDSDSSCGPEKQQKHTKALPLRDSWSKMWSKHFTPQMKVATTIRNQQSTASILAGGELQLRFATVFKVSGFLGSARPIEKRETDIGWPPMEVESRHLEKLGLSNCTFLGEKSQSIKPWNEERHLHLEDNIFLEKQRKNACLYMNVG